MRQNIAGWCQNPFCFQKFVENAQQCFAFKPQENFSAHNVNFQWSIFSTSVANSVSKTINNLGNFSFQSIRVVTRNHYIPHFFATYSLKNVPFFTILGKICPFPVPFVLQPCWFNFLFLVRLHFDCCLNMLPTLHSAIVEKITKVEKI